MVCKYNNEILISLYVCLFLRGYLYVCLYPLEYVNFKVVHNFLKECRLSVVCMHTTNASRSFKINARSIF